MNVYTSGALVRVKAAFTDATGAAADPTTVTLKYRKGASGSTQTATPVHDSTGAFHFDLDTTGWTGDEMQVWTYQYVGTGLVQALGAKDFGVEAAPL